MSPNSPCVKVLEPKRVLWNDDKTFKRQGLLKGPQVLWEAGPCRDVPGLLLFLLILDSWFLMQAISTSDEKAPIFATQHFYQRPKAMDLPNLGLESLKAEIKTTL